MFLPIANNEGVLFGGFPRREVLLNKLEEYLLEGNPSLNAGNLNLGVAEGLLVLGIIFLKEGIKGVGCFNAEVCFNDCLKAGVVFILCLLTGVVAREVPNPPANLRELLSCCLAKSLEEGI